jgi:hypothetical protein
MNDSIAVVVAVKSSQTFGSNFGCRFNLQLINSTAVPSLLSPETAATETITQRDEEHIGPTAIPDNGSENSETNFCNVVYADVEANDNRRCRR